MAFVRKDKKTRLNTNGEKPVEPKKELHPNQAKWLVQKGQVLNPLGRPKGSRNKFAEEFLKDFLADWQTNGATAIKHCRVVDPAGYVRIAASIVPKELNINENQNQVEAILEQFNTVEELQNFLAGIAAIGANQREEQRTSQRGAQKAAPPTTGSQPNRVH